MSVRVVLAPIIMFHGAHRWSGPPQLQPASMKNMEHGPGLYLTSDESTARSYAKGGGVVLRFEIDPKIRKLDDARISALTMIDFVRSTPRIKHRKEVVADLLAADARAAAHGRDEVAAATLVNLLHYYKSLTGPVGPAVAHFYVLHGIDADVIRPSSGKPGETWMTLFNLDAIVRYARV